MIFVNKYISQADDPERSNDVWCDECVVVMNEAKGLLEDKTIQDEIKQELESICNMLGSLKDECDSLIDQFYPALIQEMEALLSNPRGLCKDMGLCNTVRLTADGFAMSRSRSNSRVTSNRRLDRFRNMLSRLHTANGMNVGCALCKLGLGTLVDTVKDDPAILNGVARTLENVCNVMP